MSSECEQLVKPQAAALYIHLCQVVWLSGMFHYSHLVSQNDSLHKKSHRTKEVVDDVKISFAC